MAGETIRRMDETALGNTTTDDHPAGTEATFDGVEFVWVPSGEFLMGAPEGVGDIDERPQHRVCITRGFWLGKHPITQAQWESVMGENPAHFSGPEFPVEQVSWRECQVFLDRLSGDDSGRYRLPSEAEWEYACRAGSTGAYSFGDALDGMEDCAWVSQAGVDGPRVVGLGTPNAWGLHDMHGNVLEWCQDWFQTYYYRESPVEDPQGPTEGDGRVLRGGAFNLDGKYARASFRYFNSSGCRGPNMGFRIVRNP